jgi:hypothetical protein
MLRYITHYTESFFLTRSHERTRLLKRFFARNRSFRGTMLFCGVVERDEERKRRESVCVVCMGSQVNTEGCMDKKMTEEWVGGVVGCLCCVRPSCVPCLVLSCLVCVVLSRVRGEDSSWKSQKKENGRTEERVNHVETYPVELKLIDHTGAKKMLALLCMYACGT